MNNNSKSRNSTVADVLSLMARWLVGAALLYLGLHKALHPVEFLKLARQYDLTENAFVLNTIAAALPWFEVFCALLLLAGIAVRGTALTLAVMLVPFTGVVFHRALLLETARNIPFCAVSFDCGCGSGEEFICRKLAENLVLFALCLWVIAGRGRQLSLRFSVFNPPAR